MKYLHSSIYFSMNIASLRTDLQSASVFQLFSKWLVFLSSFHCILFHFKLKMNHFITSSYVLLMPCLLLLWRTKRKNLLLVLRVGFCFMYSRYCKLKLGLRRQIICFFFFSKHHSQFLTSSSVLRKVFTF